MSYIPKFIKLYLCILTAFVFSGCCEMPFMDCLPIRSRAIILSSDDSQRRIFDGTLMPCRLEASRYLTRKGNYWVSTMLYATFYLPIEGKLPILDANDAYVMADSTTIEANSLQLFPEIVKGSTKTVLYGFVFSGGDSTIWNSKRTFYVNVKIPFTDSITSKFTLRSSVVSY